MRERDIENDIKRIIEISTPLCRAHLFAEYVQNFGENVECLVELFRNYFDEIILADTRNRAIHFASVVKAFKNNQNELLDIFQNRFDELILADSEINRCLYFSFIVEAFEKNQKGLLDIFKKRYSDIILQDSNKWFHLSLIVKTFKYVERELFAFLIRPESDLPARFTTETEIARCRAGIFGRAYGCCEEPHDEVYSNSKLFHK